jgi:hypothetical protein
MDFDKLFQFCKCKRETEKKIKHKKNNIKYHDNTLLITEEIKKNMINNIQKTPRTPRKEI